MREMTMKQAIQYIRDNAQSLDYSKDECFAVRGDDYIPEAEFNNSRHHTDGVADYELDGVSACYVAENDPFGDYTRIQSLPDTSCYGKHQFLLVGERLEWGEDDWAQEVVLGNHRTIAIIKEA